MNKKKNCSISIPAIIIVVLVLTAAVSLLSFLSASAVAEEAKKLEETAAETVSVAVNYQILFTAAFLVIILLNVFAFSFLVFSPLRQYLSGMKRGEKLQEKGASELRALSREYNEISEKNRMSNESLRHAAEHDALTRLFNRRAFETIREQLREEVAFLIIDIDFFKRINDTLGHDVGDQILQKTARLLKSSFRFSDFICRMGGDEFIIIMTKMKPELRSVIETKVNMVRKGLSDTSDGLPPATVSVGVSFGNGETAEEIYKAADDALYDAKRKGKNGMSFMINGEIISEE